MCSRKTDPDSFSHDLDGLKAWGKLFWVRIRKTIKYWSDDDGNSLAAAVAYYAATSFLPLTLILIFVLGMVLRFSPGAQNAWERLLDLIQSETSEVLADHARTVLEGIENSASTGGTLGIGMLVLVCVGVFVEFEVAFDRIFGVAGSSHSMLASLRTILFRRLRAFLVLGMVSFLSLLLTIASISASAIYSHIDHLPGIAYARTGFHFMTMIALNGLLFTVLYKTVPKVPVRWVEAFHGGVLAAVLWEVSRQALSMILMRKIYTAYGIVGSILALMIWFYVVSCILLFAAMYIRVLLDERNSATGEKQP